MSTMPNLPRDDNGKLSTYAFPGGYPILYLDRQDGVMCPSCANKAEADAREEKEEASEFTMYADAVPVTAGINYETPTSCDECGGDIEAAYA